MSEDGYESFFDVYRNNHYDGRIEQTSARTLRNGSSPLHVDAHKMFVMDASSKRRTTNESLQRRTQNFALPEENSAKLFVHAYVKVNFCFKATTLPRWDVVLKWHRPYAAPGEENTLSINSIREANWGDGAFAWKACARCLLQRAGFLGGRF